MVCALSVASQNAHQPLRACVRASVWMCVREFSCIHVQACVHMLMTFLSKAYMASKQVRLWLIEIVIKRALERVRVHACVFMRA